MATLMFCDTHNMIAYLNKTDGSEGFHQIVDFLNSSHIKFALTENSTIYTSLIQQFWQTVVANTLDTGEIQITTTIDGNVKLIYEASIRRHLKLEDYDGISTLPNIEIFEQLALMGYASNSDKLTFQKGYFSPQWVPTSPHDSSLTGGHTPGSDEGSLTLIELTVLYATRVHTYSRRRRAFSTSRSGVSTASRIISTAKETVSTAGVSILVSNGGMFQESTSSPRETKDNEEIEKYSEDDRTKILVDLINQRKKLFAQQRAEAKRNKPMTQAQQRTYMDDLVQLWSLVKERFSSTEPNDDKDRVLWVELKRLFEPDVDDQLWKL
nr:hypothetical protein [Tanacetum cinerariifolium]